MDIGFDGGFYATKAIAGDRRVMFPSCVMRHQSDSLFSLNDHQAIIIELPQGSYLVGSEAVRKGTGTRKETGGWIASDEYYALFLGAMSELTQATQVTINLVTGLPLADYTRDKGHLRDRLLGTHQFTRRGRRAQCLKIESVRIVPQAWGAVLALLLDERGNIVRPELVSYKLAVLDIGGHNVNYLSVDGLSDVPAESRSTERGAWNVMRAVRAFLDAEHPGLSRLPDHRIMQAIIAGEVYDADERVDLKPVIDPIITDIGHEIVDTAAQYWGRDAATFRQIIICGGGAHLWAGHVRRAFGHAVVLDEPEYANAAGFYRFAVHLSNKG